METQSWGLITLVTIVSIGLWVLLVFANKFIQSSWDKIVSKANQQPNNNSTDNL